MVNLELSRMRWPFVAATLGVTWSAALGSDNDARKVVERAIEVQGGKEKLLKLRVMRVKVEGTMSLAPGQPAIPFVLEDWWQMPDRYKTTSRFELGGKKVSQTQAIVGATGWMQLDGVTQDLPKE